MGILSVLLVRHDALYQAREDTELGRKIYDTAMMGTNRHGDSRPVSSGVELVAGNIDAGDIGVVIVEGNTAYHLEKVMSDGGALPDWSKAEAHMVNIVRRLGYKVVRPRNKK